MKEDLKNILSHLSTDVDQETLLLYLQGKLSAQQQHTVEEALQHHNFEADAVDGLQDFKDQEQVSLLVEALNRDLKKRVKKKNEYRKKLHLKNQPWLSISILIFLLLVIISYFIIHAYLHRNS